ncbi:hypothetical protein ACFQL4_11005 [Halosimplex aquaticum]
MEAELGDSYNLFYIIATDFCSETKSPIVPLNSEIRDRVVLVGGKVSGVDCPDCQFDGGEFDTYSTESIVCPECGTTILTADQKSQLRQSGKL